jgi:hypothetical protein
VTLQIQDVRTGDDLPAAFESGAKEHVEGLLTTAESMFVVHRAQVAVPLATEARPQNFTKPDIGRASARLRERQDDYR